MQIMIVNGPKVLVHADIDVPSRKVSSLLLDEEDPLGGVYIALTLLESHIEEEMAKRVWISPARLTVDGAAEVRQRDMETRGQGDEFPRDRRNDALRIGVRSIEEAQELSQSRLKLNLTLEQMVTAMGLKPCPEKAWLICENCKEEWATAILFDGKQKPGFGRGWCGGCLPAAFERHMREQAALDRLVEADEPDRSNRAEGTNRPEAPTCEGGCE